MKNTLEIPLQPVEPAHDLRSEKAISASAFAALRRHALLDGCKWDPQVGDVDTLSPFPLVMKARVWKQLAFQAEQLTTEAIGAEELAKLSLPFDATPVFLLDANRAGNGRQPQPHEFDNRSISFTTDFPSANFLASHGIQRAILVQSSRAEPQSDLAHTLRRWQDAGFVLKRKGLDLPDPPEIFEVAKPSWYGAIFQKALAAVGLRRAGDGGFGAWMSGSSAGG